MKSLKKFSYIFVILFIIILSFFIYSSISKASNSDSDIRDKALSEIQYFESKIIYIFNSLNNIEFENYKISAEDISKKSKKSSETSSSAGSENGDSSSNSSGGSSSESSGESSSGSSGGSSGNQDTDSTGSNNSLDNTKKYSLNEKGVLSDNTPINWEYIKNEAEILQASISTMVLDLYEISLNNNDILNFNKEYDNLLIQIKNEDKENTLKELSLLYSYVPKFLRNCNVDEQYRIVINTKMNIFNAYSILDTEDWDKINTYVQSANETFSKLLTDINIKNKNQFTINKCYILLNGLQNSVEIKDKEIFLIKYRNLLEELNNI